jgi:nucleoside-diphosphate-sugar epimerase
MGNEMSEPSRIALVLGASGGIGGETALALSRHGWKIRAFSRAAKRQDSSGWEWVQGDALERASVVAAARGVSAIVHAVNPPGYRNWATLVLPMIENTIAAAQASGARILLPGTVYNYGPDAFPVLREESPQRAASHKGTIRIALERKLEEAGHRGDVRSLIVRFGDFFGPRPGNNWFSQGLVTPHRPLTSITYPGRKGVGHNWAYLPDAGEAFAQLMDREQELDDFARFHFRGFFDAEGTAVIEAIRKAAGKPALPVRALPWFVFRLASPFNETMRELYATRPLWETPIDLDNARLVQFLGEEPHTPLDTAVETTLRALGCLGA